MTEHPSYLSLDRAALGESAASLAQHLAECDRCRSYVDEVRRPAVVPADFAKRAKPRWLRWSLTLLVPSLAAAALLIHIVPAAPVVTAKGMPAVALYLKRGDAVALWDGRGAVRPGDQLRMKVAPEEFDHLSVGSATPGRPPVTFYTLTIPPHQDWLSPDALQIDDTPGDERLLIELSHGDPAGAHWSTTLNLPKEVSADRRAP